LNIHKSVVWVLPPEHTLKFRSPNCFQAPNITGHGLHHIRVIFLLGETQQFERLGMLGGKTGQRALFGFEARTLTTQFLGALGIAPDVGLLEFALDFCQAMLLGIKVKDTPVRPGNGPGGRGVC
jgi:hypothetical protein